MADETLSAMPKREVNAKIASAIDECSDLPTFDDEQSNKSSNMTETTTAYSFAAYDKLIEICQNNTKHFECDETETGQHFLDEFHNIIANATMAKNYVTKYITFVHEYDFDENTRANGYRSAIKAMNAAIKYSLKICKHVQQKRNFLLFRKSTYIKEVEACSQLLRSLCCYFDEILKIRKNSESGSLFPFGERKASGIFETTSKINQLPFFGRCIAFQYCKSVQWIMKQIGTGAAGLSELYFNTNSNRIMKVTSTIYSGSKYVWNPELRAERYLNVTRYGGIDFVKAILGIVERDFMCSAIKMLSPKVSVNRVIKIHPEPFEIESSITPNKMVQIPVPLSHFRTGPINARLLSRERRVGMIGVTNKKHIHSESKSLIIHCHGGGFVGMSSKSHEVYLREWAAQLHVPILSIDYSLSPEAPYPRALEEVYYVYCWAIRNARSFGTTAEKVIVIGDSAGATLTLTLALKCIEQQIRRPDGVFLCYCPMSFEFTLTPARYLCAMDVVLPFGVLMSCLKAYVHPDRDQYDAMYERNKKKMSTASIDDNSMWEHIQKFLNEKAPPRLSLSDDASDTFASESSNDSFDIYADDIFDIINLDFNANTRTRQHSSITSATIDMDLLMQPRGFITLSSEFNATGIEQGENAMNSIDRSNIDRKCLKSLMSRNLADDYLFDIPHDPFLSPLCASDEMLKQLPTVKLMTSDMDPFLDDCVEMAKRLKRLCVPTGLDVVPGLPHGFLNFVQVSKDAHEANQIWITRMAEVLNIKF